MFEDRKDAGRKLAKSLSKYKGEGLLVLAIPRGGVEVGYHVARELGADFSMIITRKLPLPANPEAGFGAISEDGSTFMIQDSVKWIPQEVIPRIKEEQKREIERRIKTLRKGKPLPDIKDRTVILVDDGIAMGSTMGASILLCKSQEAKKIIVASPISSPRMVEKLKDEVDEVIILETPLNFRAVAQGYLNWYDVSDEEVSEIMERK
ncbi:MAG: phosphoribosyltransferase [Candidatus Omnitrophica bacterium]|nr:phosphoribosyltransferase [Candidatus Omnitrophota bacterium]MBD3268815.1 phosphoribosyltransferase [Candidatus Omnitrophota bacterium]